MNYYSTSRTSSARKVSDKSGTLKRRKSAIRDGDFIADLAASGFFPPRTRRVHHVVVSIKHPPVSLPISHPDTKRRKHPLWRDTGEKVRGLIFHETLAGEPKIRVKAFTLMLSKPVEAQARFKGKNCLAWLHKRLVRQLRRVDSLYPSGDADFWFAIEEGERSGKLHLHGEIAIPLPPGEKHSVRDVRRVYAPIRTALKRAGGQWDEERDGEGTQLRLAPHTPDCGWAGYCVKNVDKARPEMKRYMRQFGSPKNWLTTFEGKTVTASATLNVNARELYAKLRGR
jgi:hypothetical protein